MKEFWQAVFRPWWILPISAVATAIIALVVYKISTSFP
jgi:hypothetical protein